MATELEKLAALAVAQAGGPHPCNILGHEWRSAGGRNAGCGKSWCMCSVPVNECAFCLDCDYGDNEEAREIIADCREGYPQ
jgi:hypothetical protein